MSNLMTYALQQHVGSNTSPQAAGSLYKSFFIGVTLAVVLSLSSCSHTGRGIVAGAIVTKRAAEISNTTDRICDEPTEDEQDNECVDDEDK